MSRNIFFRMFPLPAGLNPQTVGIDISDRSLKFFELRDQKSQLQAGHFGEIELVPGIVEGGRIILSEELIKILKELAQKNNFSRAVVSLPEDRAYTIQLRLPLMKLSELRQSIEFQLEDYIPLPLPSIVFDYQILIPPTKKNPWYEVAVSIMPRETVDNYTSVLMAAGIIPLAFEIEAQAMSRSLLASNSQETCLIVDIGKVHTGFFVANSSAVFFASITSNISGDQINSNIARELKISEVEAEKLKNEIGLNCQNSNQPLFFASIPMITSIKDEIIQRFDYWQDRNELGMVRGKIDRIILCGGQASLPGLIDFLQSYFEVPVELGNPWRNIYSLETRVPDLSLMESLRYSTAIGLSLRLFEEIINKPKSPVSNLSGSKLKSWFKIS